MDAAIEKCVEFWFGGNSKSSAHRKYLEKNKMLAASLQNNQKNDKNNEKRELSQNFLRQALKKIASKGRSVAFN